MTWKDIVEPDRPQVTILRVRITRWIPTATHTHTHTHTHTEYVTFIVNKQTYKNLPSNTRLVLSRNASCFGSHEPSSGISLFLFLQQFKKTATIDHAIKIVVGKSSSWHQQIQEFKT
jgi:hypothetical protein